MKPVVIGLVIFYHLLDNGFIYDRIGGMYYGLKGANTINKVVGNKNDVGGFAVAI